MACGAAFTVSATPGANGALTFGDAVALDGDAPAVYPVMAAVGGGLVIARVKGVKDAAVIAVSRQ